MYILLQKNLIDQLEFRKSDIAENLIHPQIACKFFTIICKIYILNVRVSTRGLSTMLLPDFPPLNENFERFLGSALELFFFTESIQLLKKRSCPECQLSKKKKSYFFRTLEFEEKFDLLKIYTEHTIEQRKDGTEKFCTPRTIPGYFCP